MGIFNRNKIPLDPAEAERKLERLNKQIEKQEALLRSKTAEVQQMTFRATQLKAQLEALTNAINAEYDVQSYGFYSPTYVFANSDLYKAELQKVRELQKNMMKLKTALTENPNWTVNGSIKDGKKMISDTQKLLLQAFNVQCDDIVAHITIANHQRSIERIKKLADSISNLGRTMGISITVPYVNLKIYEANLALDFAQKKQEEKERLRELREQQREEAKAQKEIEEAKRKLEKEQKHYQNALESLNAQLEKDPENSDLLAKKRELQKSISETSKAIADVDYRQANVRAGYVYIISNIGAFGENVYKIGMTRRLEPMDRVDELGDASVPFKFDVHALIFTEDAPGLESALHRAFENRKVNKINPRREFFYVSLDEIKRVVRENFDKTVEWIDIPSAEQYRQSLLLTQKGG